MLIQGVSEGQVVPEPRSCYHTSPAPASASRSAWSLHSPSAGVSHACGSG
jgi:hypothetical protein